LWNLQRRFGSAFVVSIRHSFARHVVNRQIDPGTVFDLTLRTARAAATTSRPGDRHCAGAVLRDAASSPSYWVTSRTTRIAFIALGNPM
jgi:hypothetical protein